MFIDLIFCISFLACLFEIFTSMTKTRIKLERTLAQEAVVGAHINK